VAAHNEADWIEYNLRNCYDEFDIIRVVEGAVEGRPHSTPDGHSTDGTLDIIRNFPDPHNKIELYTLRRHFKSLEEGKQIFLDVGRPGDWNIICDVDEFYMEGSIERLRRAIEIQPLASEFIPTFLHFYRDFWHIKAPHPEWNLWHQRILRWRPGLRYHTHPVATDSDGHCTYFSNHYQTKRFFIPSLYVYHYGHAKGKAFHTMKREFYQSELRKFALSDGMNASQKFDEKYIEFVEHKEHPNTILEFNWQHPTVMTTHPLYEQHEETYINKTFAQWTSNYVYGGHDLPVIPLMMLGPWKTVHPFYNVLRV
jgi:glycosyltransferase involved in cell wall biosynthesis